MKRVLGRWMVCQVGGQNEGWESATGVPVINRDTGS